MMMSYKGLRLMAVFARIARNQRSTKNTTPGLSPGSHSRSFSTSTSQGDREDDFRATMPNNNNIQNEAATITTTTIKRHDTFLLTSLLIKSIRLTNNTNKQLSTKVKTKLKTLQTMTSQLDQLKEHTIVVC